MRMPDWWTTRRLGLFVHASSATVPAWAPIGEDADWYRSHLGDADDVTDQPVLHPSPLVEVLAHHRERWGHIERYDDFVPLLTFDEFDAESWARLAREAGAGYSVFVAKHHDGWAWWDAPNSTKRLDEIGPTRNVLAEYAAACERNDIVFGTSYSLLDWGDTRYPSDDYVTDVLHREVIDLVERYGTSMLWGDGHWGHDGAHWRTAELLDRVRALDPDVVVNDQWRASSPSPDGATESVRTFEYHIPDDITAGPWELRRGIGLSLGYNRTERAEHHMTGSDIVDLYTEVLAKGGNLLLGVGPASDGTIPELQAAPLRDAGTWIRRFDRVLSTSSPWDDWGDAATRLVRGADGAVYGIDVDGSGHFATIDTALHRVCGVERVSPDLPHDDVTFEQRPDGLHLIDLPRPSHGRLGSGEISVDVFRFTIDPVERPVVLFEPAMPSARPLAPLLDDARPGDIVQLGDGTYLGPASVPAGVVVRGLGAGRTTVHVDRSDHASVDPAVTIGRSARVEHLSVTDTGMRTDRFPPPLVVFEDTFATMLGCSVHGMIRVDGDDVMLRAVTGRTVVASNADRLSLSRCAFSGNRWDVGVHLDGGDGQMIESSDFAGHLCAIRCSDTTGTEIRHNTASARWWGVHLDRTEDAHVHANHVRSTMRAVDIDGGANALVDGNAVVGGDSGCIVQAGAAHCEVTGNHWENCRVGLLAWDATDLDHHDNVCVDLHEPDAAHIVGP